MVDLNITVVAEDVSVLMSEDERLPKVAMEAVTHTEHWADP